MTLSETTRTNYDKFVSLLEEQLPIDTMHRACHHCGGTGRLDEITYTRLQMGITDEATSLFLAKAIDEGKFILTAERSLILPE